MRRARGAVLLAGLVVPALVACGTTTAGAPGPTATAAPTGGPAPTTTSPAPTTTSAPPAPPTCAQQVLQTLTPPQRAAQLVMVGVPAADPASAAALVARTGVGGVFLQGRSAAPIAEVAAAVQVLRAAAGPAGLLVSADQEGGQVQTLSGEPMPVIPPALEQGGDLAALTTAWAGELVAAGVDLDLAPVADVVPAGTEAANPPIGVFSRQYGSTPEIVAAAVTTVVRAARDAGLATTAKHFPGLGRVTVNTDTDAGATDAGTSRTDGTLLPFQAAIDAGTAAVMVSSASYPGLDGSDTRALFSRPIVTDLLRGEMGFGGLVLTDDVGAAAAVADVAPGDVATRFLAAGGDVVLTVAQSDVEPMTAEVVRLAEADRGFGLQVEQSVLRVLQAKDDAGLLAGAVPGCRPA